MSGSKHLDRMAWGFTAFILVVTLLFMKGGAFGLEAMERTMGYEDRLFDNTKVHTLDIVMEDWNELIQNATSEEYYAAALVIDGEAYKNVGIRGKGNTSLSTVASMDSDRYSFKVEFDHYDSSMTYHGLDKLSLNNLIQDATMMKDYLTYTLMKEFSATAPLCSFVYLTVNGEDWGLYLAVEGVEESFLQRNYGTNYGNLYKPDSSNFGGGRGHGKDFRMDDFLNREEDSDTPAQETAPLGDGAFAPPPMFGDAPPDPAHLAPSQTPEGSGDDMPDPDSVASPTMPGIRQEKTGSQAGVPPAMDGGFNPGGKGGMGSADVKLQYIDENIDSYTNIWDNAKTTVTEADQARLIESLKKLSDQEQLESVVDIEAVIRYFVVHNYVCNGDSYTGSMIHNYYLYESDGQLSMIPWDYNLAYGTFHGGDAQGTINTPIDAPVSGGSGEDRPMWNWIVSDANYTELYHQYFAEFLSTVDVQALIDNAYSLVKPYVEKDPTAFYTVEEFETGVETLRRFCDLRSQSVSMQLENGETEADMNYVDASSLTLTDMGSMGRGMPGGGMPGLGEKRALFNERNSSKQGSPVKETAASRVPMSLSPAEVLSPEGESTEADSASQTPDSAHPPQGSSGYGDLSQNGDPSEWKERNSDQGNSPNSRENVNRTVHHGRSKPGGAWSSEQNRLERTSSSDANLLWLVGSVFFLGCGLLIAKKS